MQIVIPLLHATFYQVIRTKLIFLLFLEEKDGEPDAIY